MPGQTALFLSTACALLAAQGLSAASPTVTSEYGCWQSFQASVPASWCKCTCDAKADCYYVKTGMCGVVASCSVDDSLFPCTGQRTDTTCSALFGKITNPARCTLQVEGQTETHAEGSQMCRADQSISTCRGGKWVDGAPALKLSTCSVANKVGTGTVGCPLLQTATATRVGLPKSLIMMVPDGGSVDAFTLARFMKSSDGTQPTAIDSMLYGSVKTWAVGARVTDSASAGTAYSAGKKTYNAGIAVLPVTYETVGTNMEAAKEQKGMLTGVVVTSRVTHATPAAFVSHVYDRDNEYHIARQMAVEQNLDVVLGGGSKLFNQTLRDTLTSRNYTVVDKLADFGSYCQTAKNTGSLRVYGLFSQSHMPYEIDRKLNPSTPSLAQMVKCTLEAIESNPIAQSNGFFIMIEGSRIDHAEHSNDPGTTGWEALHYADDVISEVKAFIDRHPNVAMMSAADHATGGMTLGRDGIYDFYPDRLVGQQYSGEYIESTIVPQWASAGGCSKSMSEAQRKTCASNLLVSATTLIKDYFPQFAIPADLSGACQKETDSVATNIGQSGKSSLMSLVTNCLVASFSRASLIGWTTGGHDGKDIGLYCYGNPEVVRKCNGNHENSEIGKLIFNYLGLDADLATAAIRKRMPRAPDAPQ
eukprot:comp19408_c0_seq1/m.22480 comp19408_c0_seq1/g.22480  ORF comp19408_c0_seq1/g.22480 comp19408_c0_seq1/m.22480 type:complete len:645 (-) comp19408_c0_seq1:349-2283(-)